MPVVSVVMPVYNTEKNYLKEAIASVLNQSFRDFELLIVDDCSKPYIKEIISSYHDDRIKYFRLEKNSGPAAARNHALAIASGKYIAPMDSDDISRVDRLKIQVKWMEDNTDIGCLGSCVNYFGDDADGMKYVYGGLAGEEIDLRLLLHTCVFIHSSVMFRKDILDKYHIRYRQGAYVAEDYGFYLDLIGKTRFFILNDILLDYRSHGENLTHTKKALMLAKDATARIEALRNYCGVEFNDESLLRRFWSGAFASSRELREMNNLLTRIIKALSDKGYSRSLILRVMKKFVKKMYYHTDTVKGQWMLMFSPLAETFNLSFPWRCMCFIVRGLFYKRKKPDSDKSAGKQKLPLF